MPSPVPRTVKAVDTATLIQLDTQAIEYGFSRNHGRGWLAKHAAPLALHYLHPFLLHRAGRRPELDPHWRCMLLLTVRDGQEIFSLLDVWPASFDRLPETLDRAAKQAIVDRLNHGELSTQAQWASLNP
ncbi:hypothetical protein [Micromonospora chalcea]|uniref:hypothetical protein n=1 Tax=Micromonospora chalcea TaxID=1874 RepID=UPI00140D6665|nr:hypothetical protein [Micromonospora sp. CMU55-4]